MTTSLEDSNHMTTPGSVMLDTAATSPDISTDRIKNQDTFADDESHSISTMPSTVFATSADIEINDTSSNTAPITTTVQAENKATQTSLAYYTSRTESAISADGIDDKSSNTSPITTTVQAENKATQTSLAYYTSRTESVISADGIDDKSSNTSPITTNVQVENKTTQTSLAYYTSRTEAAPNDNNTATTMNNNDSYIIECPGAVISNCVGLKSLIVPMLIMPIFIIIIC